MPELNLPEGFNEEHFQKMLAARTNYQNYVFENARRGDVQNIIDTIDKFAWTKQWLMNIGDRKGKILDQAIQTRQPKTVLELGTFLGYSSLRMIAQLPKDAFIISIEPDSQSAEVARCIHEYAGVADRIKIVNDYSDNVIPRLKKEFNTESFDFIFIDHVKEFYLRDLKMLEEYGLIRPETMIFADNVIIPGAPDYLEYVRNNSNYTTTFYEENLEYRDDLLDGIEISIRK